MGIKIIYFRVLALFMLFSMISCQTEEMFLKGKHIGKKSSVISKYLTGKEAKDVAEILKKELRKNGVNNLNSTKTDSYMRMSEGEIDFNNILLVLDSLGIKNYTFKIINHPDDDYKTFHNLVLTEKESELNLTLMKYEMTELFAQEYNLDLKSFYEFQGKITAKGFSSDPCVPVSIDYPNNGGSSSGGGSGGGGGDGPPAGGDGPPSSGGGGSSSCAYFEVSFECSCGRTYGSWANYVGSICGNGSNPGYTLTIVVRSYLYVCRLSQGLCDPDGSIGVIDPKVDCNTFDERVKEIINTEGGFVNDPIDPGGATNKGISWKVWIANANTVLTVEPTLENLEILTDEQAKLIYKHIYWDKVRCDDIIDGDLKYLLFDFYVNAGGNAVKLLKRTLNNLGYNLTVNSIMDDETVELINNYPDIISLYNTYKIKRKEFYNNLVAKSVSKYLIKKPNATQQQINSKTLKKYLNGWLNRANKFLDKTEEKSINVNC